MRVRTRNYTVCKLLFLGLNSTTVIVLVFAEYVISLIRSEMYKKQISVAFIKWVSKNSYISKVNFGRNAMKTAKGVPTTCFQELQFYKYNLPHGWNRVNWFAKKGGGGKTPLSPPPPPTPESLHIWGSKSSDQPISDQTPRKFCCVFVDPTDAIYTGSFAQNSFQIGLIIGCKTSNWL